MKILQVITSLHTGGAEKLIVDMVPLYIAQGHQVDVLLFDGTDTPFKRQLQEKGVTVYELGKGRSVYNPMNLFKLVPFLRKYDIVHTHNTACQLFAAIGSVLCSVVLVTTEHTTSNRRRDWKWYRFIDKWMYSRYKKVICISDQAQKNLLAYLGNVSNVVTIYNGIDYSLFKNARSLNGLRIKDETIVTMVAGFRYQKDHETLIRAIAHLPENVRLWLIGDGERRSMLEQLARELGIENRVRFWGVRSDIPEMLKTSDIIVMSSHFEGLSLSSIEGMSVGKPFVASDVDGLHEITKGAGILFPHGDDHKLAETISRLISDKSYYNEIANRCMERASHYDIHITVEKYQNIYQEVLQNK